jgi:hypothetical protein
MTGGCYWSAMPRSAQPAGGQGMNLGLRDAVALAEALSVAIDTQNDEPLQRYDGSRRGAAREVLGRTDRLTQLATLKSPVLSWTRNRLLRMVGASDAARRRFAAMLAGFPEPLRHLPPCRLSSAPLCGNGMGGREAEDDLILRFGVALAIGMLVGLERGWRERDEPARQPHRRHPHLCDLRASGGIFAALSQSMQTAAVFAVGFLGFSLLFAWFQAREAIAEKSFSVTRVIVGLCVFALGGLAVSGGLSSRGRRRRCPRRRPCQP